MSSEAESTSALIERMRAFEADHVPDGWLCIRMRDSLRAELAASRAREARMREALGRLADLYDADEGCRSLPEYIAARAALAEGAQR